DSNFCTRTRVTCDCLHLNDAVIYLRHLLGEKFGHELRMRTREKNLRTAWLAPHIVDVGADAISVAEQFTRQQFVPSYDRLAAAEVGDDVAIFYPFDNAVDDVANAGLAFLILALPPYSTSL